ncbi:MAG TPA: DUF1549 and DUF1553 domain-containing protein [Tepidisphaeraceae bacterium]|nr:DUF1549 and DUF1553 domain-containing protein [Tepidisphaeraceae bacterium]
MTCVTLSDGLKPIFWLGIGSMLKFRSFLILAGWMACAGAASAAVSHWSFVAPTRPALPEVKDSNWVRNPIDRFVLAKLESEGLKPSPEADKVTLLRRLSLDLVGLPPTIDEVSAFLADSSPDAYEKQVERLLASPHYGERWGRQWLDAARYADSDGFEKDKPRLIWFYRDYVINAFNRDLPYNQFIIEQLAGDQLPHPTQDQIVATGFLRNSMVNEEGGVDPEQFRMDAMFDRMDCLGKSVLGLTVQCAQCHNHKFDPFTQEDYYRLFAYLNNDNEAQRVAYEPDELMKIADIRRQTREIEAGLRHTMPDWQERMAKWEESVAHDQPEWVVLSDLEPLGDNSQRYIPQKDGSVLAQGYAPTKFTQAFRAKADLANITAFRLELFPDPNLPAGGPGRSIYGTCALSNFAVSASTSDDPDQKKPTKIKFVEATSDYDQPERPLEATFNDKTKTKRVTGPVKFAIDDSANTAWGIDAGPGRRNVARKAVFRCDKPIEMQGSVVLKIQLQQNHGGWNSDDNQNNNLGRFRISVTNDRGNIVADPLPKRVRDILSIPREKRSEAQTASVFSYWRTTLPECKEANEKIDALWDTYPEGVTTFTLASRKDGRQTAILSRGDWLKPTATVTPGVPAFLHNPLPANAPPTRLTLAKWLVDPKSPTTARAFVNRIWQTYFGTGIVATSEDLGMQGEKPSHPELLDWLACEFMHPSTGSGQAPSTGSGQAWSIKHMHRLIVTSATYRQSSKVSDELYTRDPYNRLLARGPRFRVEGEIVRDIALSASGLLNEKVGGPSVTPPAPAFLFLPPASYAPFPWVDATGPDKYRRAIYTFRRRSTPYPVLQTFDVPNGESSCVRRLRSNSPLQALASLNEPIFVECAQALARRSIEEGGSTDQSRIEYAFKRVLARSPDAEEKKKLLGLLNKEEKRLADGSVSPNEIATGKSDATDLPAGVNSTQLAAYTLVSRVLLNLDETITKE